MSDGTASAIDPRALARGALVGLAIIVPVTVLRAALDRALDDFDDSAWKGVLFVVILAAFLVAGWSTGRLAPSAPLSNGALAALGAIVLWLPIRLLIWFVRDDSRGLVSGEDAALSPGQLLGTAAFAAALGMLGGMLGARRAQAGRTEA
jgi:hypothetical protein